MAGKKEITKSFRTDEEFAEWLGKQLVDLDCTLSDLIIKSILFSVPLFKASSTVFRMIALEDFKSAKQ